MIPQVFKGEEYSPADHQNLPAGTVRLVGILFDGEREGNHCNFGYGGYIKALVWDGRVWASLAKSSMDSIGAKNTYDYQYEKERIMADVEVAMMDRMIRMEPNPPFIFWWWKSRRYAKFSDIPKKVVETK